MDLIAAHNQDNPSNKVSLADLKPNAVPDFQCRGTVALKNGILTCECYVRADAHDSITHKKVAGFDAMSNKVLRKFIIERYIKFWFNNCRIQPLKMMIGLLGKS